MILFLSFLAMAHDAAFEMGDSIYVLHGGSHVRYQKGASEAFEGYPKPNDNKNWPGLEVFRTRIVAALNQTQEQVVFFLSDGRFLIYDMAKKTIITPPQKMSDTYWNGLSPFAKEITAAYRWNEHHSFFFLSGGRVLRYDHKEKKVDDGYPKLLSQTIWGDVHPDWGDVQQIVSWSESAIFLFFSSGTYAKYQREQQKIAEKYPKKVDERRWPGMGAWLSTEARLSLIPWKNDMVIEKELKVSFQLPQHMEPASHIPNTAVQNRRFLTMSPELVASSEYPDIRSSFQLIPLEPIQGKSYMRIILQDSSGRFLSMSGTRIQTTNKKKDAEVFFLDMTWGEYVILYHHPKHPRWSDASRTHNLARLRPIVFVADKEDIIGTSNKSLHAGALLRMYLVQ